MIQDHRGSIASKSMRLGGDGPTGNKIAKRKIGGLRGGEENEATWRKDCQTDISALRRGKTEVGVLWGSTKRV